MGEENSSRSIWANKNITIGIIISVVVYSIALINWAIGVKHEVDLTKQELSQIIRILNGHQQTPAHGTVLPTLAEMRTQIINLMKWKDVGGRFTQSDGDDIIRRIEDLRKRVEEVERNARIQSYYPDNAWNPKKRSSP